MEEILMVVVGLIATVAVVLIFAVIDMVYKIWEDR